MPRLAFFVGVCAVVTLAGGTAAARPTGPPRTSSPSTTPTVNVSPAQVRDGDTVLVTGNDWPASTQVAVQVCGAGGEGGSAHCDLPSSTIVGASATGTFGTQLVVHNPPVPCPCVVKVYAVGTDATRSVQLQLAGAPTAPVPSATTSKSSAPLRVESARIEGGSWAGWFGVAVTRTLVLRVHNVSGAPVNRPLVLASAGRASRPDATQAVPPIGPFAIDETRTIRVPVELGAMAIGGYRVRVRAGAEGTLTSATTTTQVWPWGLFAIALVLIQMVLLAWRNATRRHLDRLDDATDEARVVEPVSPSTADAHEPLRLHSGAPPSRPSHSVDSRLGPASSLPPLTWKAPTQSVDQAVG
jgi:hypothetical protein